MSRCCPKQFHVKPQYKIEHEQNGGKADQDRRVVASPPLLVEMPAAQFTAFTLKPPTLSNRLGGDKNGAKIQSLFLVFFFFTRSLKK